MVELLVVISIIVILASMGMAQYRNSVVRAREAVLKEDLFRMRDAIDQYYADKNKYPSSLDDLVTDGYMREVPIDPITQLEGHLAAGERRGQRQRHDAAARHLRREERIGPVGAGRHPLRGLELGVAPGGASRRGLAVGGARGRGRGCAA